LNSAPSRHGVEPGNIPAAASFQAAFEKFHRERASRTTASIWGDKSPHCYNRMTWLARKFPGASFIVVWRNSSDTARSMLRAAASGNSYFRRRGMKTRSLVDYRVFHKQYQSRRAGIPDTRNRL
jgi:Sulfotransferase family